VTRQGLSSVMPHVAVTALTTVSSDLGTVPVSSAEALRAELSRVAASVVQEHPVGITVERSNGDALMVVVGGPGGVLSFTRQNGRPPYFVTLGDPDREGVFAYWLVGGHHGELPLWSVVPHDLAADAVVQLAQMSAGLPSMVTWASV